MKMIPTILLRNIFLILCIFSHSHAYEKIRERASLLTINDTTIHRINIVNGSAPLRFILNAYTEYVLQYNSNSKNPYRISTLSNNSVADLPVLVVVRQAKQVTSWQIPALLESTKKDSTLTFPFVARTMCHDDMGVIAANPELSIQPLVVSQSFIIGLSTSSVQNVSVVIKMEEVTDFYVQSEYNYSITVSPTSSRYVYYKFDNTNSESVVIILDSNDDLCLTVSVQDTSCPVFDSNKDVKYEGIFETINKKGALTIKRSRFKFGFYLVFVAKPDNYDCSQERSVIMPRTNRLNSLKSAYTNYSSTVTFTISDGIPLKQYVIACMTMLGSLTVFGLVFTALTLILNRYGTISKTKYIPVKIRDYIEPLSEEQISKILKKESLTVDLFAKYPKRIKKRSYNYLAHIMNVALFYSIPVIQLVVTYQRVVNVSGDLDLCYYNFLCSHPAIGFSDFNHIYSNIGYILIGIFYIFAVLDRHTIIKITKDKGIPVHYGLYHAMGVAMIIEGLLSAGYHICPSQSNYQFDTSFMYVMAVLVMVKLYQNRHPDINSTAYTTFTFLGFAIFIAMVGILDGAIGLWIVFIVSYAIFIIILSFKIYYVNYVLTGIKQLKSQYDGVGFTKEMVKPLRTGRFIALLLFNVANFSILGGGIYIANNNSTDFGTFLLGLLGANTVLHCIFYTVMKLLHKERICYEAIFYGILGIACWIASGIFFLDAATLWMVSPAESRQWNQGCIFQNFYDKHDIWHLLSAPALYFTFMYLMYVDDDIADKNQSEIPVF